MDVTQVWGNKDAIGSLKIAARSAVTFAYMTGLLRITGMRPFGKGDVFDSVRISFAIGNLPAGRQVGNIKTALRKAFSRCNTVRPN